MSFAKYFRSSFADFLLVWLSASCLSCVGFDAFFLESATWRVPAAFMACAVLVLALFFAGHERRGMAGKVVLYLVLVAVLVGSCLALSGGSTPYDDAEGNYFYLGVVIACASTAAYLLTRTVAGSMAWFLANALACSTVQAFYQSNELLLSVLSLVVSLTLVVYRNFRVGLLKADVARTTSARANLLASAVPVLLSTGAALAVWFLVIAPLNPGVLKITLVTDYRHLPIEEVRGVANEQPQLNLEMTSKNLVDGFRYTTDDLVKGASDTVINAKQLLDKARAGGTSDTGQGTDSGTNGGLDRDSTDQEYDAQSYTQDFPVAIVALLVIALLAVLVAAFFVLRRRRRMRRLERMLAQEPIQQVESLYLFLFSRLGRLGFALPAGMTVAEYARASSARMATIEEVTRVPFTALTDVYVASTCGEIEPAEDDIVPFVAYYLSFWKAARNYLGNFRYFFRSFRL